MSIKMEIDKQLLRMFENFPHTNMTDGMSASFQKACEGKPLPIITDIVDQFVFGRCDRQNKTFLPTVAEFTDHLERAAANWKRDQHKALSPPEPRSGPSTKDQKRRVRMLQATFHAVRDREKNDAKYRPGHELQSRSYRKWAEREYEVKLVDGWPVYAKTGERVLSDEAIAEAGL